MPVKVRCPECDKVLTLPDAARGKTAKCSNCEARVPVPGAKKKAMPPRQKSGPAAGSQKRGRPRSQGDGGEELFANLDLSRSEDRKIRVCPKCGLQVDEEDIECPKCNVTLTTGRLSAERQRKKKRGGPDPDEYYEKFIETGWEFTQERWMFGVRTMLFLMIASVLVFITGFMTIYVSKLPLKVFWVMIAFVVGMIGPGWCWFLHTTLIDWSFDQKTNLDRIHFDFFTCVSLGIKFFAWLIVFCAPFQLVFGTIGGLMIANDMLGGGIAVIALGFLPGFFCFPVVMPHMSMPIQWPGWLSPRILQQYFKGLVAPSMYWCMFCAAGMLPSIILGLVIVFVFQEDLSQIVDDLDTNARMQLVLNRYEDAKLETTTQNDGSGNPGRAVVTKLNNEAVDRSESTTELSRFSWWLFATEAQMLDEYQEKQSIAEEDRYPEVDMEPAIIPAILWIVACAPFGFAAVFMMRTNGLLTTYFRPELDLIAEGKQVVWKRRMKHGDEDEEGRELEGANVGKYAAGIGGVILFFVVINVIVYFATDGEYLILPRPLARALNLISD